jgi:tRNA(Arg) A34 adenosine deaminase TadA
MYNNTSIILKLIQEASKSTMTQKHAAVLLCKGKIISPMFHNNVRTYVNNVRVGSIHAEMAAIHYIVNRMLRSRRRSDSYVLRRCMQTS